MNRTPKGWTGTPRARAAAAIVVGAIALGGAGCASSEATKTNQESVEQRLEEARSRAKQQIEEAKKQLSSGQAGQLLKKLREEVRTSTGKAKEEAERHLKEAEAYAKAR